LKSERQGTEWHCMKCREAMQRHFLSRIPMMREREREDYYQKKRVYLAYE